MSDLRPLCVHAKHLSAEDRDRIKEAKRSLCLPFQVQFSKAVYDSPERVLSIGTTPDFPCDYYYVESTFDPGLAKAVLWVLTGEGEGSVDMVDQLSEWLGGFVTEVIDANEPVDDVDVRGHDHVEFKQCPVCGGGCGPRGCTDPNMDFSGEREYRRAVRTSVQAAKGIG